jgi:hypothetical protein
MGAPFLGEPGGGFFVGDPESYIEKALLTGTSLYRGSASGVPGGGLISRGLWELDEGAVGMGYRCLKGLHGRGLRKGSFQRGT